MKNKAIQFLIIFLIHEQPVQAKPIAKWNACKPSVTKTINACKVVLPVEKH